MPFFTSPLDSCLLHYVDHHPTSQPPALTLIFLHGWPMSSAMFSHLFPPLLSSPTPLHIIAPSRRGFGKSEYTGSKPIIIDYDTFAGDTLALLTHLSDTKNGGLGDFVLIAASMGCGESLLVYNLLDATLRKRCKGFIWLGPSLPFPLAIPSNPTAPPRELWDAILKGLREDRYAFTKVAVPGIFGQGVIEGLSVKEEDLRMFENVIAQADGVAVERCIEIITAKDFTLELKSLAGSIGNEDGQMQLLVLHGECDQSAFPAYHTYPVQC
jgi:non-heme chloroperoxidase